MRSPSQVAFGLRRLATPKPPSHHTHKAHRMITGNRHRAIDDHTLNKYNTPDNKNTMRKYSCVHLVIGYLIDDLLCVLDFSFDSMERPRRTVRFHHYD